MNEDALLPDPVGTFPEPDSQQPLSLSLSRLGVVPSACLPIRSELFPLTSIPTHNSFISHFHVLPVGDTVVWQSCSKAPNCLHKTCSLDQIITVRQECSDRTDNETGEERTGNSNSRRGRQRGERQWETSRQFPSRPVPVSLTALLRAHMRHMKHMKGTAAWGGRAEHPEASQGNC